MTSTLHNLLLSAALIAVPAGGFALARMTLEPAPQATASAPPAQGLGDLTAYRTIVHDTQAIVRRGDLSAAENRITDLETLWDQNAGALRPADPGAWGAIDSAADGVFSALRAQAPDRARVEAALASLAATLDAPAQAAAAGPVRLVSGVAVTDETGHALPCEAMIGQLRDAIGTTTPSPQVADLLSRALERCNADDDTHADALSAQAIAQIRG